MYVKNKVALVTGGASGIGLAYAKKMLKNGLKGVTLVDINTEQGNEAVKEITKEFGENKAIFVRVDVVNKAQVEDAMKKTVEKFANFDILINNAGIMNGAMWEREIDINLKGTWNGCLLAFEEYLPKYKSESSEPVIVNVSSTAGLHPLFFMPTYCATKYGIIALSKALALEKNYESQKVRVLTLCPGPTKTPGMEAMETRAFTPRHVEFLKDFVTKHTKTAQQEPEAVGDALLHILEKGQNGSIWVAQEGKVYQIEVPDQKDMKIIV